jgi:hypothetical protein
MAPYRQMSRHGPQDVQASVTSARYWPERSTASRGRSSWPAAGEPTLEEELFDQVQAILQANKDRYQRRGPQRYTYLLSGLLACGSSGE